MSERVKRILFIAFFVLFAAVIGVSIYMVFFRPQAAPEGAIEEPGGAAGAFPSAGEAGEREPSEIAPPGTLPGAQGVAGTAGEAAGGAEAGRTSLLYEGISRNVSQSADGTGARYYDPAESKFYRISADGVITELSGETFPDVESVAWGNASDQAIIMFPDGTKVHYDFETESQTTLPQHWEDFDFSADDSSIVAKSNAIAPESRFLFISNPDGSGARAIQAVGENGDKTFPSWTPNNQIIAYAAVGDAQGFDREQIALIGKNQENFRGLLVEGRGFLPLWSPSGEQVLYSVWNVASDYRPELWISGGSPENMNRNRTKLDIMTWADKCAWADEETVYCAVPNRLPRGAGLQRELFSDIGDTIVKIDLRSGAKTPLGSPGANVSVRDPVVTEDGATLIFSDAVTGDLYAFRLQ
jgi:hypothetical protein